MQNYDENVVRRMKRIEGQVRGVLRMMEERQHCKDVVGQMSAIRGAIDKAIAYIVAANLEECVLAEQETGGDTKKLVKEAVELLMKSR